MAEESERFSVIVPCYNGAATLDRCLRSLREDQGDLLLEIVLVDDGSTDDSVAIAEAHGCRVIQHPENRGSAAARNTGAREARGDVFIFVDTDVVTPPQTVPALKAHLDADPSVDAVNGTYTWAYEPDSRFGRFFNALMYVEMERCPLIIITSFCAIRRAAFETCEGFDERIDSAYADDITFGWVFKNRGLISRQYADIECSHLKTLSFRQWARHSFNHGQYWTESFFKNIDETAQLGGDAVTSGFRAWNVALVTAMLPTAAVPLLTAPLIPFLGAAFLINNRLVLQTFHQRNGLRFATFGAAALAGESVCYLAGASRGLLAVPRHLFRNK